MYYQTLGASSSQKKNKAMAKAADCQSGNVGA